MGFAPGDLPQPTNPFQRKGRWEGTGRSPVPPVEAGGSAGNPEEQGHAKESRCLHGPMKTQAGCRHGLQGDRGRSLPLRGLEVLSVPVLFFLS